MNNLFLNLSGLIKEETEQYRELFDILHRERDAMKNLSLEDILNCSKLKETVILKLKMMEESRIALLEKIAMQVKIPKEELTLLKISEIADSPFSDLFMKYYKKLSSLARDIKEMNLKNKTFAMHSLECVNGHLGLLNHLMDPNPVYLPTGKMCQEKNAGNKIIYKEV